MNTYNTNNTNNTKNNNTCATSSATATSSAALEIKVFCSYCKNNELNGHIIATCPVLAAKNDRKKKRETDFGKAFTKSLALLRAKANGKVNAKLLENIKCHWCNEMGHYKSDCKIKDLFLMEEERVCHELRNAKNNDYEKNFPSSLPIKETIPSSVKETTKFAWASVALYGIPAETLKKNAKEDAEAKRAFNNMEYKRKKQGEYEARMQKKEDDKAKWSKIKPVILKMKQAFPTTWQDKVVDTECDTQEAENRRLDIDEKERQQEAQEEADEERYLVSFEKERDKRSNMSEKEQEEYDRDLDDDFDMECARQDSYGYGYYFGIRQPQIKQCEGDGCNNQTEQGNHSELCLYCIFGLQLR